MMTRISLVKGFFALFPKMKKSAKLASHSGSELLPESSPSTPAAQLEVSVEWGAAQGTPRWQDLLLEQTYKQYSLAGSSWCRGSCGTAKRMRREGSDTGTGTRVSPRLTSLLFLLRQSGVSCRSSTETGRRHPCHGAVAGSLGFAIEITQLQFIDQVFDVLVAQV